MNRIDFLNLTAQKQLIKIEECGEVVINYLQGNKNITLYKVNNILVKVVSLNGQNNIEVISETDVPRLFVPNS